MQIYPDILGTDAVSDSRQMIIDRENSIKSSFSGPRAPTVTAEDVGCIWYCTADSNFYGLYSIDEDGSNPVWQKLVTPTKLNAMDLGTPTTETLYVDLEGAPCEAKKDMFVLVEHTILPVENYEITNDGMRVTFVSPIPAGLKLEIRWFVQEVIGRDGATFVPSIVNNVLTWDNDQGLVNPPDLDFNANLTEIENFANEQIVAIKDSSDAEIEKINNAGSTQVATVQSNGASQVNLVKQTAQEYINTMDDKVTEASNSATEAAESAEAAAASAASVDADNIVHKTGNEIITNTKTFTGDVIVEQGDNDKLFLKDTRVDASSETGTDTFNTIIFRDKNNFNYGNVAVYDGTDGSKRIRFSVQNKLTDGTTKGEQIWVQVKKDGTISTYAPRPTDNSNDSNIAVTNWVRKLFALLTGNNTFSGTNTFTSTITRKHEFSGGSAKTLTDVDTNGKGSIAIIPYYTGNKIYHRTYAENTTSGKHAYLDISINDDGLADLNFNGSATTKNINFQNNTGVYVPTPATSDNSTRAATTAWFRNNMQVVTSLPSSPTAGVFYFVKE